VGPWRSWAPVPCTGCTNGNYASAEVLPVRETQREEKHEHETEVHVSQFIWVHEKPLTLRPWAYLGGLRVQTPPNELFAVEIT